MVYYNFLYGFVLLPKNQRYPLPPPFTAQAEPLILPPTMSPHLFTSHPTNDVGWLLSNHRVNTLSLTIRPPYLGESCREKTNLLYGYIFKNAQKLQQIRNLHYSHRSKKWGRIFPPTNSYWAAILKAILGQVLILVVWLIKGKVKMLKVINE